MAEQICPECHNVREDFSKVCPRCGAPPIAAGRLERGGERPVRTTDLEPYVALRYIARLFKVLAVLMVIMTIGEVIAGLMMQGRAAIFTLLTETTRLLIQGGLMWIGGDLTMLLIDLGHDIRVSRILLGRMNAELHHRAKDDGSSQPAASAERRNTV